MSSNATELHFITVMSSVFNVNVVFGFIFIFIVTIGIVGNLFVSIVIIVDRRALGSIVNLFILNLTVADLSNILFCCPDIVMFLIGSGWLLPNIFCPALRFFEEFSLYTSVLTQVSIGIERYLAICKPLKMQRLQQWKWKVLITSVWMLSAIFASPYVIFHRVSIRKNITHCSWDQKLSSQSRIYFKLAECIVFYFFPLVLLTILYSIMSSVLWGKSENIANEAQQSAVLNLRRSVIKMLMLSILLYFICYSPIQGIFITEFFLEKKFKFSATVRLIFNALSLSSSSINPIVYIGCCCYFRQRFLVIIRKLFKICRFRKKWNERDCEYNFALVRLNNDDYDNHGRVHRL